MGNTTCHRGLYLPQAAAKAKKRTKGGGGCGRELACTGVWRRGLACGGGLGRGLSCIRGWGLGLPCVGDLGRGLSCTGWGRGLTCNLSGGSELSCTRGSGNELAGGGSLSSRPRTKAGRSSLITESTSLHQALSWGA